MKNSSAFIIFLFFLLCPLCEAFSQHKKSVSLDVIRKSFDLFIEDIEDQTDYHFYYDPIAFDSLEVTMKVSNLPVERVLSELLKRTNFTFAIDYKNRVFLTVGAPILTRSFKEENSDSNQLVYKIFEEDDLPTSWLKIEENKTHEIGNRRNRIIEGTAQLKGVVRNIKNGEPLVGVAIYVEGTSLGTTTDGLGNYSLSLPKGEITIRIKSFGMNDTYRHLEINSHGVLDISLKEKVMILNEVEVKAGVDRNINEAEMGYVSLSIKDLKKIPSVFGESDILRTMMVLPGVKSVGESSVGLNIRGGSSDQNLILFADVPIFNASHLFGFFSAFNPDVIKNVELHKSSIPSKYGGRLSSVIDIEPRDGNKKDFVVSGGVGPIMGRLSVEGPTIKEKGSFLVSGRSSYSNWILKKIDNPSYQNGQGNFYDLSLHVTQDLNKKNSLTLSGYWSDDQFKLLGDTLYSYQNRLISLKWKHIFSNGFYSTVSVSKSNYSYDMESMRLPEVSYNLNFKIDQQLVKANFNYDWNERHQLNFGLQTTYYQLQSGDLEAKHPNSLVIPNRLEPEQGIESAVFFEDKIEVSPSTSLALGVRYSQFNYLGPKTVFSYREGFYKDKLLIDEQTFFTKGKNITDYGGFEWRATLKQSLGASSSLKLGFNTLRQYLHLLTNTMTIAPTDVWKMSDVHIKPQEGNQFSFGWYKNLYDHKLELSVESYYKSIYNYLDFKSGDSLILNHYLETSVIPTKGKNYGIEMMLKKAKGKLNGWVAYTYSRSLIKGIDPNLPKTPNKGEYYPTNFDKPHDVLIYGNYRFSHRFNVSLNFTYSTGRPYTPPIGKYYYEGAWRAYYADRNQYRVPDYYRMDFSVNIEGNHKVKKILHSSWTLAVYNLLGRRNVSSIYFKTINDEIKAYRLSIFGEPIPTITYNFRF